MFVWLLENIATIIVCIGLLAAVAASVFSMIRSKKKGKSPCGCGCTNCSAQGFCHKGK